MRREEETRSGKLSMPAGTQFLIGTMFIQAGVKVHYSVVDNDDTLAAYS